MVVVWFFQNGGHEGFRVMVVVQFGWWFKVVRRSYGVESDVNGMCVEGELLSRRFHGCIWKEEVTRRW